MSVFRIILDNLLVHKTQNVVTSASSDNVHTFCKLGQSNWETLPNGTKRFVVLHRTNFHQLVVNLCFRIYRGI